MYFYSLNLFSLFYANISNGFGYCIVISYLQLTEHYVIDTYTISFFIVKLSSASVEDLCLKLFILSRDELLYI